MTFGPTLVTERLSLRPPAASDFDAYADYVSNPDSMVFIGGAQDRALAWRSFTTFVGAWAIGDPSMFFVFEQTPSGEEGRFVGRIGPWRPEGWPGDEVGWGLRADAQGNGYAGEAATAAIDFAFDTLGWTDVIHVIDPLNTPSQALARRLGSTNLRECWLPSPINKTLDAWGQSREQWKARRKG